MNFAFLTHTKINKYINKKDVIFEITFSQGEIKD